MRQEGIQPSKVVFLLIIKACSSIGVPAYGMPIHMEMCKVGLEKDTYLQSALVEMYSKCGFLEEAKSVFGKAERTDLVLWSSFIGAYIHCPSNQHVFKLYEKMLGDGVSPDKVVFLFLLQACGNAGNVAEGFQLHKEITLRGLDNAIDIENTLMSMYAKCGDLNQALGIFHQMQFRDEVSWTAIIIGYVNHGQFLHAVELFTNMQLEGFCPSTSLISSILIACGNLSALKKGHLVHEFVTRLNYDHDHYISNALLHMYSKCKSLRDSQFMFNKMSEKDMASWSSIILGYAEHGQVHNVLFLLEAMQLEGLNPDKGILMCSLSACGGVGALREGNCIHCLVFDYGVELDTRLASAIVCMYIDCGALQDALATFGLVAKPDLVLWTALIDGCCELGQVSLAVRYVEEMVKGGAEPDESAYMSLLRVSCGLGSVVEGRLLHSQIVGNGFDCSSSIHTSLLDMYTKCGNMEDAYQLFTKFAERDMVSWGCMLSGYAMAGNKRSVNQCLKDMAQEGLKPTSAIFTSILRACSHAGLLEHGCQYFQCMRESFSMVPGIEHYDCMADLLARVGQVNDATDLLRIAPSPIGLGCSSLLTSYQTYGD